MFWRADLASDLDARFQLYSRNPPDAAPSGAIQITGFDGERHNRLYLNWCTESACNDLPRPGPR